MNTNDQAVVGLHPASYLFIISVKCPYMEEQNYFFREKVDSQS